MGSGSEDSALKPTSLEETKQARSLVETAHSDDRVDAYGDHHKKNGLRTYSDDEDHEHEPPVHI